MFLFKNQSVSCRIRIRYGRSRQLCILPQNAIFPVCRGSEISPDTYRFRIVQADEKIACRGNDNTPIIDPAHITHISEEETDSVTKYYQKDKLFKDTFDYNIKTFYDVVSK